MTTSERACFVFMHLPSGAEVVCAMQVGKLGRWANRTNLLSESPRFGFSAHEASSLIDTMKATISARWAECIRAEGGSRADVDAVAPAFDYPGFEHVPEP